MSGWLVALDFGTTATAVAVRSGDGGMARALVFGDGASTAPSSVFAEGDGRLLVGAEADNEAELRLDAYEPTPKRRAADSQIRLGEQDFGVAEVIGAVMAPALAEAMQQNNNTVPDQVVLTHPVAWRARRRAVLAEALSAAATRLGVQFPEPVFVAEPVAAAQWYAHTDPPAQGAYFAVYDLGGGTFDTTVLQATDEGFEVIASGGVDPLGGFDFDAALFDYLGTKYIAPADSRLWAGLSMPGQPDPELARQRRRLQQRVGLLKLGLSTSPDKQIQLPGMTGAVVVTRGEYEALITRHIDNTVGELEDTIADAGLAPDKLTAIYRIGGAARTPLVGAALARFRVPIKVLDQPKLVVAQGAATPQPTTEPVPGPTAQETTPRPQTLADSRPPVMQLVATTEPAPHTADATPQPHVPATRSKPDNGSSEPSYSEHVESKTARKSAWRNRGRLAVRALGITQLFVALLYASGGWRLLLMLFSGAWPAVVLLCESVGVIGATICAARKHGRAEAVIIFACGIAGFAPTSSFTFNTQILDLSGYVGLVLLFLTRPPRTPTAADSARYVGAGLSVITVTLAMTADYSSRKHLSFGEAFDRFESGDLWIPAVAGLAMVGIGAYHYNNYITAQPEIYPTAKLRRGIVLVLVVAVLIPAATIQAVLKTHPAQQVSAPPFDGAFTKSFGTPQKLDGTPDGNAAEADVESFARSSCGANGCIAVGRFLPNGKPEVWDYIDSHWIKVLEFDDDTNCNSTKSTEYVTTSVSAQPDGSLAGDQVEEWTAGCYEKASVTYRRTGSLDGDGQLPDPSTEPPRQSPPPAVGFHGKYRSSIGPDSQDAKQVENWAVETDCLRTGERCLSFASSPGDTSFIALIYQSGSWTGDITFDQTCSAGTDHSVISYSIPLPSNASDPIQKLSGSADYKGTSTCAATGGGSAVFERTGD